jgi:hypothetical protein
MQAHVVHVVSALCQVQVTWQTETCDGPPSKILVAPECQLMTHQSMALDMIPCNGVESKPYTVSLCYIVKEHIRQAYCQCGSQICEELKL